MDPATLDLLRKDAARYIWWEMPEEVLRRPSGVIAQVMNLGDFDDVQALFGSAGGDLFRDVLRTAEPGWFNERSWHYWHYRLGLCQPSDAVPPLPERQFNVAQHRQQSGQQDPLPP
jgi:hypothetical protein